MALTGVRAKIYINENMVVWLDKTGIAEHLKVSPRHVTNLVNRRILPVSRLGRVPRFDRDACDRAVKAMEQKSVLLSGEN